VFCVHSWLTALNWPAIRAKNKFDAVRVGLFCFVRSILTTNAE
jgi:hypothetical protein